MKKTLPFIITAVLILMISIVSYAVYTQKSKSPLNYLVPADYSTRRIHVQPFSESNLLEWQIAEGKWKLFAEEHMERMRRIDGNTPRAQLPDYEFDREWFEIKHPLISKHLADYRVFSEKYFTFALNKTGQIITIGTTWPGGAPYKSAPDFETKSFSDFIHMLSIPVNDRQSAFELVQLKLIVDGSHGYPTAFDYPSWKFKATKEGNIWIVRVDYVGDPTASIGVSPSWEVVVGEQNRVQEVIEKYPNF